jgi:PAS domain S-box-containing protein
MSHGTPTDPSVAKDPAGGQQSGTPENRSVADEGGRRTEPALRLGLEAAEIGVWEWDIATGEVRWSENLEQIHGIAPGTFGKTFEAYRALIHPDDRERVMGAIRGCIEGRVDYEIEFRYAGDAPGVRWMLGKGKVLVGDGGQPFRLVGVCMDITKRKQAEEAVSDASRRKDEFLAMVSHELRDPLAVIVNAATLLAHLTKSDPAASQANAAIHRQTDQLVRIVDDLLDVSRLSAGKMTLERTSIDLVALVHRTINDFVDRRLLDRHRYELRFSGSRVNGDGPRLQQIVSNLLMNAIKYTPPGGKIILEVEPEGSEAVLRVKDSGVGIGPDFLPRVFDLFAQSDRAIERREAGLGVGLSIARSLVEAHGGRIEARSAGPGKGSEFTVRLPLTASLISEAHGAAALPRRRILIVDDNQDAREALSRLLEIAGHEVSQAGDGPSGLEVASRARPDVAIIDIGLPGMNGFEVARRLKAGAPGVRLIALTGYGQGDHRRLGDEAGFERYLIKPVAFETLQRALANN